MTVGWASQCQTFLLLFPTNDVKLLSYFSPSTKGSNIGYGCHDCKLKQNSPSPCTAQSHPSVDHSLSMTDIQDRQVGQQVTSPDPVKNLVANRKRLESRIKAAQEVGRQVSGETCMVLHRGDNSHTYSCKQACMYTHMHMCTYVRTYTQAGTPSYITYPLFTSINHFSSHSTFLDFNNP